MVACIKTTMNFRPQALFQFYNEKLGRGQGTRFTANSPSPTNIDTTDVQSAEVVFFENRLFLRCSFADNSQAQGCIIRLTLSSTNETERFQISHRSGSLCTTANNQREAYSSVVILDWEENGMEGNVSLDTAQTVVNVSTLEQYTEITGCRDGTFIINFISTVNEYIFYSCCG